MCLSTETNTFITIILCPVWTAGRRGGGSLSSAEEEVSLDRKSLVCGQAAGSGGGSQVSSVLKAMVSAGGQAGGARAPRGGVGLGKKPGVWTGLFSFY